MSSSSSSSSRAAAVPLPSPLYPFQSGAELFKLVKPEDAHTANPQLLKRCWFATCIHALAHDPAIFALAQEAVIVLDTISDGVAMALLLRARGGRSRFTLGCQLAQLVQQASCPTLVKGGATDLFKVALKETLRVIPSEYGADATQEFITYYPELRDALLMACAVLVPDRPALPALGYASSDGFHLETDLAAFESSNPPEWILVKRAKMASVAYNPDRVRVGSTAIYKVAFTVQFEGAHYLFATGAGQLLDSHTSTVTGPVQLGSTGHVINSAGSHLFLHRVSK